MLQFLEILRLIRLANCLLASVGVWIGAYLTWLAPSYYGPTLAGIGAFFVCAAGNVLNDYLDVEADRINRPDRVLVRGALSRKTALRLVIAFNLIALITAMAVSWSLTGIALLTIALLVAYNFRLKKVPVLGNMTVALLAGMTFVTGGFAVAPDFAFRFPGPLVGTIFAFLFHLVREIIKDVQDTDGDRKAGWNSLALKVGARRSLTLALGLFVLLVLLTYVPVYYRWFGRAYTVITVYLVDLPLLALLIIILGNPTPRMLAVGSTALKVGMVLGLVALVLA